MTKEDAWVVAEGLNVSRESWSRIVIFVDLLLHWQPRINLVSSASLAEIWSRHIIDSLQILPHLPNSSKTFADLGSGSGCPALPLAIASGKHVHLYESNGKKAAFLREALRTCGAAGTVHQIRLENVHSLPHGPVQAITARALAPLETLLTWAEPFFAGGAQAFFHKGQDVDTELTQAAKSWRIQSRKHQSLTDSRAVILQIEEVARV